MKKLIGFLSLWSCIALLVAGCDSKDKTVEKSREAVKEVISQPFNTLNAAKDSVQQSEDKQKAALEEPDKEIK